MNDHSIGKSLNPTFHTSSENDAETPVFLVGALRSGTTMLRIMLNHHPKIAFPDEFEFVTPCITKNGAFPREQTYHEWLQNNRIFRASKLNIDKSMKFEELCHSFLEQFKDREKKQIIGTTVHNHFERLSFVWPKAKYIHLIRDGRDVARSFIPMGWASNTYNAADHWLTIENAWDKLESNLEKGFWHKVRYEDLLYNPEAELKKICDYIGVEYDPAMLEYPKTTTYSSPDPKLAYQWVHKQTPEELGLVEGKIGEMLVKRGYELSGYDLTKPSWLARIRLMMQNKIYVINFRIKRYGLPLVIAEIITRKVGMKAINQKLNRKIDLLIEEKYLK